MTDYRHEHDDEQFRGAEVFGFLKSGKWLLISSDDEEGILVIENVSGETFVLRKISGSEQSASGPDPWAPDE